MGAEPIPIKAITDVAGGKPAADALFTALYAELRRLARFELARQGGPEALSATTLLHKTYIEISASGASFEDRKRFMGYAARVMRGLVIDHARNQSAQKRGGGHELTPLEGGEEPAAPQGHWERLSEALDQLAGAEPGLAEVVDLKFFCGFTFGEIAAMRGVSERTVQRQWEKARIYLHAGLKATTRPGEHVAGARTMAARPPFSGRPPVATAARQGAGGPGVGPAAAGNRLAATRARSVQGASKLPG
ncbi:MAG: ECF-type sigma factor [Terriglobales bacterium]